MLPLKNILFTALLLCSFSAFSQADEEKANANNYSTNILAISHPVEKIKLSFPVRAVHVYDIRFDTSCLGISSRESGVKLRVLKLKKPLNEEVRQYYSSNISSPSTDSGKTELHCFIKKLILSNYIKVPDPEDPGHVSKGHNADLWAGILFTADYYVFHEGAYTAFCRFDTTITGSKEVDFNGESYLSLALKASLEKISRTGVEKISKGRKLTREEIDQFNEQRFDLSVLRQPPEKGIYYTFNDFLKNKPSPVDFLVEKDRKGDFLYIKNEKGEPRLATDLWGYCDGKDTYIYSANNYFKLQRTGNGFKTYGAKELTGRRNLRPNFGLTDMVSPNSNMIKDFFILDMETGELY
jgi:hypothetical protein